MSELIISQVNQRGQAPRIFSKVHDSSLIQEKGGLQVCKKIKGTIKMASK
jgi:hypothetical protein